MGDSVLVILFNSADRLFATYGKDIFDVLSGSCLQLYMLLTILAFVWHVIKHFALNGEPKKLSFYNKKFLTMIMISAFLSSSSYFDEWIFMPVVNGFTNMSIGVLSASNQIASHVDSLSSMVGAVSEHIDTNIVKKLYSLSAGTSIIDAGFHTVMRWAIIVVFWFVEFVFFILVFGAQMMLVILFAVSPIFILCFGFDFTKPVADQGINLFVNSCLRIFFAGIAMGLSLYFCEISTHIPVDANGNVSSSVEAWAASKDGLAVFFIALFSLYIHLRVGGIADSLSRVNLGIGLEASFAAGAVAATGMSKRYAAGKYEKGKEKWKKSNTRKHLYSKVGNWLRGG